MGALPENTLPAFTYAIEAGVAFMPGEAFYPDDAAATGTLRLNFSHADEADIDRGLATLAGLCASHMAMG